MTDDPPDAMEKADERTDATKRVDNPPDAAEEVVDPPGDNNPFVATPEASKEEKGRQKATSGWDFSSKAGLSAKLSAEIRATFPQVAAGRHWQSMVSTTHEPSYIITDPAQWEAVATYLREKAHNSWRRLSERIQSDEQTIIDLWKKKEGKGRRKLVAKHWPNMASEHRPDLRTFMERRPEDGLLPDPPVVAVTLAGTSLAAGDPPLEADPAVRRKRDAILFPYMTADYLVARWWSLAQMLHSRGREPVQYFALQDMPPGRQDFLELFIQFRDVPHHYMIIHKRIQTNQDLNAEASAEESRYGHLVAMEEDPGMAFRALAERYIMPAGQGLVLLEIQEKLYTFLAEMAEAIFESRPKSTPGPVPEPDPELISGASAGTQLVWVADERDEAHYTGSSLQIHDPESSQLRHRFHALLLKAKYNEALDHWRLLRSDPGYFMETVTQWKEHRVEMLLDTRGRSCTLPDTTIWINAITDCVTTAFQKLVYWDETYRRVQWLKDGSLAPRSVRGEPAGPAVGIEDSTDPWHLRARCFLYVHLSRWERLPLLLLRKLWTFSPRMRPYSRRVSSEPPETLETLETPSSPQDDGEWRYDQEEEYEQPETEKNPPQKEDETSGQDDDPPKTDEEPRKKRKTWLYFEWLFSSLFDPKVRQVLGLKTIVDEMDLLLNSSRQAMGSPPPEHWMLSDLVYSQISDLATHSQLFDSEFKSERESQYEILFTSAKDWSLFVEQEVKFGWRWEGGLDIVKKSGSQYASRKSKGPVTFEGSSKMWSLGMPADGRFDFPVDKPVKTDADMRQLDEAKKALGAFWLGFDGEIKAQGVSYLVNNISVLEAEKEHEERDPEVLQSYVKRRRPRGDKAGGEREPQSGGERLETEALLSDLEDDPPYGDRHLGLDIRMDVDKRALKVFRTMFVPAAKD